MTVERRAGNGVKIHFEIKVEELTMLKMWWEGKNLG